MSTDPVQLLHAWCDALLARQIASGPEAGGLYCDSHRSVHGRCGELLYPLLALHRRTRDARYLAAAHALHAWAERRVSRPDGAWTNEPDGRNDWTGITCFAAISLGEALRHHGDLLSPEDRARWGERLRRAADYLLDFQTFERGDINYPVSSATALALAGTLLASPRHLARARELVAFALGHLTENALLWGEGERGPADLSPRGLRPIDLPYNVAETLPNLALYATVVGDSALLATAARSLRAHLEWMLPDGGWDAGWCTRLAKWTYWGSRTTDGALGGLALLRAQDPLFALAAGRQLRILSADTHRGLLHGGPHVRSRGRPVCIHPAITHAKGLALALDAGLAAPAPGLRLPSESAAGVRAWPETGVTRLALGPWRASFTLNDIPCTAKRGGRPSGGSPCLVWHAQAGPLLSASLTDYVRYEGDNMDEAPDPRDRHTLTPRLDLLHHGVLHSSLHDTGAGLHAVEAGGAITLTARGTLRDAAGRAPAGLDARFEFTHVFRADAYTLTARVACRGASLHFPLISAADEPLETDADATRLTVRKPRALVGLVADCPPCARPGAERFFNYSPGFEVIPLAYACEADTPLTLRLSISLP
jgi:hypothetical protein